MNTAIEQALSTLCVRVQEMPLRVLRIFNDFFREERVDMQGFDKDTILSYISNLTIASAFRHARKSNLLPVAECDRDDGFLDIIQLETSEETRQKVIEVITSEGFITHIMEETKGFILVHFPKTTVTNEYDRSTVVKNLYIKVPLLSSGAEDGMFTMNRSEYTVAEMHSNYMHSHAHNIPTNDFRRFTNCCLGSGPLTGTQTTLNNGFDEDRWNIFCLEISKYVEVESIAGIPYHRLENIRIGENVVNMSRLSYTHGLSPHTRANAMQLLTDFFNYYLDNNNLTFSYRNGVYSLGMSYIDYLISLSNSFIEWVNSNYTKNPHLITSRAASSVLREYVVNGDMIYDERGRSYTNLLSSYREYIGQQVCIFKGSPVTITISGVESTENVSRLLEPTIASLLLYRILRTINYRYGRIQEDPSNSTGKTGYAI